MHLNLRLPSTKQTFYLCSVRIDTPMTALILDQNVWSNLFVRENMYLCVRTFLLFPIRIIIGKYYRIILLTLLLTKPKTDSLLCRKKIGLAERNFKEDSVETQILLLSFNLRTSVKYNSMLLL